MAVRPPRIRSVRFTCRVEQSTGESSAPCEAKGFRIQEHRRKRNPSETRVELRRCVARLDTGAEHGNGDERADTEPWRHHEATSQKDVETQAARFERQRHGCFGDEMAAGVGAN